MYGVKNSTTLEEPHLSASKNGKVIPLENVHMPMYLSVPVETRAPQPCVAQKEKATRQMAR